MNEAFTNGFIKRAQDYGVNQDDAVNILKEAALDQSMDTYRKRRQNISQYLMAALGAVGGGYLGHGYDKTHNGGFGGALAGAAAGGAAGYGVGALRNSFQDYTGKVDPWSHQNEVAPSMPGMFNKVGAEAGPYSLDNASKVRGHDEDLKGIVKNRKEHFGHYMLNPFVRGPIHEAVHRIGRRYSAARVGKGGWAYDAAEQVSPVLSGLAAMSRGGNKQRDRARNLGSKHLDKPEYFSK